jgi:hypothetical protein
MENWLFPLDFARCLWSLLCHCFWSLSSFLPSSVFRPEVFLHCSLFLIRFTVHTLGFAFDTRSLPTSFVIFIRRYISAHFLGTPSLGDCMTSFHSWNTVIFLFGAEMQGTYRMQCWSRQFRCGEIRCFIKMSFSILGSHWPTDSPEFALFRRIRSPRVSRFMFFRPVGHFSAAIKIQSLSCDWDLIIWANVPHSWDHIGSVWMPVWWYPDDRGALFSACHKSERKLKRNSVNRPETERPRPLIASSSEWCW